MHYTSKIPNKHNNYFKIFLFIASLIVDRFDSRQKNGTVVCKLQLGWFKVGTVVSNRVWVLEL